MLSLNSYSQNCTHTLDGIVHDFHDAKPLSNAIVLVKELNKTVTTNSFGVFSVDNLCSGEYHLEISHIGCDTVFKAYTVNKNTSIIINLEHHLEILENVVITGFKHHKEAVSSVETTLDHNFLTQQTSTNISDIVEKISGVSSFKTGNGISKPIIHGMHSSRVAIINHQSRLQDQEWGIEHDPSINLNNVDNITVVKGASTLEYGGDIIGGAVIMHPIKPQQKDTLFGAANTYFNSNGKGFGTLAKIHKFTSKGWYFSTGINYDKSGDFKSPAYNLSNTGFDKKGFSVRVGHKKFTEGWEINYSFLDKSIGILRASHVGSTAQLVNAINSKIPSFINDFTYNIDAPKQEINHQTLQTSYFKRFKGLGKLSFFYNYQINNRLEFDRRRAPFKGIPVVDLTLKTHQAKIVYELDKNHAWKVKLGLQGQYQSNFPDPRTSVKRLIPDYTKTDFSAFVIGKYDFNSNLIADLGVRYDYSSIFAEKFYIKNDWERKFANKFDAFFVSNQGTQVYTEPTFTYNNISAHTGLWWKISDKFDSRFSLGLSQRNPNPAELFSDGLHQSAATFEIGDLGLKQETSLKFISELAWHHNNFDLKASPFAQYFNGYIFLDPEGITQTTRGFFQRSNYLQTDAFFSGLDVDFNYDINQKLSTSHSLSYVYARDITNNTFIIHIPPANGVHRINYNITKKWNTGLKWNWSLKQNNVPNNDFTININNKPTRVKISEAPKGYALLGINSNYSVSLGKSKLQFSINVENILNQKYRSYLNRLRYFGDESGRNIHLKINYNF